MEALAQVPVQGAEERAAGRERLVDWLVERGPLFYAAVVVGLSLVKYGLGIYPSFVAMDSFAQHWQHPMATPAVHGNAGYLLGSPVAAVAAGLLHLTSLRGYLGFSALLACAAIAAPFATRAVRHSGELRLGVALLVVGGAVPALLLDWVGSYDPVSMAAAAVAALASNPAVSACAWAVFAFNNAPQAALALVVYALVLWADGRWAAVARVAAGGAGALAGYIGIRWLTASWGGGVSQVTLAGQDGLDVFGRDVLGYWPVIVFSALGVGWLLLLDPRVRRLVAARVFFDAAVVIALFLPLLVLDASRIVAGTLWPGMLLAVQLAVVRLGPGPARSCMARLLPAALVVVVVLDWDGSLVYAGWDHLYRFLEFMWGHAEPLVS